MAKNNRDYDNVFKTLKYNHKRLFVPVINKIFDKHYDTDAETSLLPTGGIDNSSYESEEKESDFLMCIEGDAYLLECQSYPDGTMAIRIAEYAFNAAKNNAITENGKITLNMPAYSIIYVKSDANTPRGTEISFSFPDGSLVNYNSKNIILSEITKESLIADRLFALIPFYITRYEKIISDNDGDISQALEDLLYFRKEMERLYAENELKSEELIDIEGYINRIIKHITDGNTNEERLVRIMGGTIEETPSHVIKRMHAEKIALNFFKNGDSYEMVRKSIPIDEINDGRLLELFGIVKQNVSGDGSF
ncbi:MAG: hypothetical protein Q4E57_01735 [Eubacteriales bacterium]|nr:hypothetical protein [Eubacteriales bacterium]